MNEIRDQLQARLNRLYLDSRRLAREYPDPADFWPEFAGRADDILDGATPEEYGSAVLAIERMLKDHGLTAQA